MSILNSADDHLFAITAAVQMNYDQAGAADPGMTHEKAFETGKSVGLLIAGASMAGRNMMAVNEHLRARQNEGDSVMQLCRDYKLRSPSFDAPMLEIIDRLQKLLDKDSDFLNAQNTLHGKEFTEGSAKLVAMKKK
ncbi:hypothetical protein M436DRAFT_63524 [Aureobasidium namibiae CBS 147.97]|uniref:Uncharacterized protein n=1 Tax=Aureobasidium namibiae CBS 147.97 TaxID=1043004 RepID=A0A074WTZ2_9PEZI